MRTSAGFCLLPQTSGTAHAYATYITTAVTSNELFQHIYLNTERFYDFLLFMDQANAGGVVCEDPLSADHQRTRRRDALEYPTFSTACNSRRVFGSRPLLPPRDVQSRQKEANARHYVSSPTALQTRRNEMPTKSVSATRSGTYLASSDEEAISRD